MKRVVVVAVAVVVAAGAACSLNPQPFPPDNPDGAVGAADAGKQYDASTFGDGAGETPDATTDGAPVPESEGGADADASDAAVDVTTDAPNDAIDDVALDVGAD